MDGVSHTTYAMKIPISHILLYLSFTWGFVIIFSLVLLIIFRKKLEKIWQVYRSGDQDRRPNLIRSATTPHFSRKVRENVLRSNTCNDFRKMNFQNLKLYRGSSLLYDQILGFTDFDKHKIYQKPNVCPKIRCRTSLISNQDSSFNSENVDALETHACQNSSDITNCSYRDHNMENPNLDTSGQGSRSSIPDLQLAEAYVDNENDIVAYEMFLDQGNLFVLDNLSYSEASADQDLEEVIIAQDVEEQLILDLQADEILSSQDKSDSGTESSGSWIPAPINEVEVLVLDLEDQAN